MSVVCVTKCYIAVTINECPRRVIRDSYEVSTLIHYSLVNGYSWKVFGACDVEGNTCSVLG